LSLETGTDFTIVTTSNEIKCGFSVLDCECLFDTWP
jgi:hypothetical protein